MNITVKEIPARLHRTLKARAKAHGRSLNTEVLACLQASAMSSAVDVDVLLRHARAVRGSLKVRLTERDLVLSKREGRA